MEENLMRASYFLFYWGLTVLPIALLVWMAQQTRTLIKSAIQILEEK